MPGLLRPFVLWAANSEMRVAVAMHVATRADERARCPKNGRVRVYAHQIGHPRHDVVAALATAVQLMHDMRVELGGKRGRFDEQVAIGAEGLDIVVLQQHQALRLSRGLLRELLQRRGGGLLRRRGRNQRSTDAA
eukprot:SAG31_NODE_4406_length_3263_cov_1.473767_4_plen_135_part_00